MPIILDMDLYNKAKELADKVYKKPSGFKSAFIIKTYKNNGGLYLNDNKEKKLKRWLEEKWGDIGNKSYPVYRPFIRITKDTPLTVDEIDPKNAIEQIKLKQKIKGSKNLPPFKPKKILHQVLHQKTIKA